MSIYIGNLAYEADDTSLLNRVEELAPVKHSVIVRDAQTGRSKGFAFVTLADESDEDRVVSALEGEPFMERKLRVIKAHSRTLRLP